MKNIAVLLVLSLSLFGCAGIATKQAEPVVTDNAEAFSGKGRVILGDFRVSFVTFDKSSAKAESPMFSSERGYAKSTLRAKLTGVPDSVMQQLTDAAYRDFEAKLKASGYTLVDGRALADSADWQKMDKETSPVKTTSSFKAWTGGSRETATFAPSGMTLVERGANGIMPYHAYVAADKLGTPILSVNYLVHFVYFGSETDYQSNVAYDYKGAEYSAEVSAGQGIQVVPGSGIEFMSGAAGTFNNPNGRVTVGAPVLVPGPFGRSEDATSGMQKAANAFSSVLGMVSGSASSAKEINIKADPDVYAANAKKALLSANERLVSALAAAK
jgi:hypothetical protein